MRRQVAAGRAHQQRRRGLVAADQQHDAVDRIAADRLLDVHADEVAEQHGGRPHVRSRPSEITGNSTASRPPPRRRASRARRASRRCALQGVSSDQVLQMPMTGRPSKTSSGSPWFRIQLRWMKPSLSALPNQAADRSPRTGLSCTLVTPSRVRSARVTPGLYTMPAAPEVRTPIMAPLPLQHRPVRVPAAPPTRARHVVTTFAVTLAIITYIDRVCISQAAPRDAQRPAADGGADGLGVLGVFVGVRALRDSRRVAGRSDRPAPRADAHRDLVVDLHGGDRLGLELRRRWSSPARCSERARPAAFPT